MSGRRWYRGIRATLWFSILVLLLAACGGGGEESTEATGATATTSPSQSGGSTETGGGLQDQTFAIDQHFWHSGFRVEVVEGEILSTENALTGAVSSRLTLSATLENLGADRGFFGPSITVTTSTNSYSSNFSNDVPEVPGGLKGQATLVFPIDQDFDLASAQLLVGSADENQAQVPLSGNGDAVRLEPSQPPVAGTLSMELIDLTFTAADLRYDIPDRHREVDKGKVSLTLSFDALSRRGGNWQIFATDFALMLPNGTAITPDAIEIGSLPGSDAGVTTADRYVQFLIDEASAGDYTLRLTPGSWFVGDDGATEAIFEFTLG